MGSEGNGKVGNKMKTEDWGMENRDYWFNLNFPKRTQKSQKIEEMESEEYDREERGNEGKGIKEKIKDRKSK